MSNFKSGSGNLDFGDDTDEEENSTQSSSESDHDDEDKHPSSDNAPSTSRSDTSESEDHSGGTNTSIGDSEGSASSEPEYPYFVRRSNVGDERDTRLEIHVRDKVAEEEGEFRNAISEHLGTSEVSKTDAREFALLAAYEHPERVAELMQEEGFGALD